MVSFKLENIGLIENTQITLNDFTLICGQNNTGKTYITYSIYGFLYSWNNMIDFDIAQEVFTELEENGFYSLNISAYETKVNDILQKLSIQYTSRLGNIFSVEEDWFDNSNFEVSIDNFKLDLGSELENTLSSPRKDVLQIKKSADSNILEVSTLSSNIKKQIPRFILQSGINRALGEIYFKQYFK
ncbi:AAA family ATPase, partial [Sulfuricurvum sp.]|uniref:AAA family ATPase n=1 Tax=Sulfuricurvum sp. TaxID=2025608 RepID=UPI003BB5E4DC